MVLTMCQLFSVHCIYFSSGLSPGQTQEVGLWKVLCPCLHPSEPDAFLLKGVHFWKGRQDLKNNHVKEIIIIYNVDEETEA